MRPLTPVILLIALGTLMVVPCQGKAKGPSDDSALNKPISSIKLTGVADGSPRPVGISVVGTAHQTTYIAASESGGLPGIYKPTCYGFRHPPLFFEQRNLERCGQGHGCATTAISATAFLANTIVLPYRWAAEPCGSTRCGRGDCPTCGYPTDLRPLHDSLRGVAVQAAAAAGFVFLLL